MGVVKIIAVYFCFFLFTGIGMYAARDEVTPEQLEGNLGYIWLYFTWPGLIFPLYGFFKRTISGRVAAMTFIIYGILAFAAYAWLGYPSIF